MRTTRPRRKQLQGCRGGIGLLATFAFGCGSGAPEIPPELLEQDDPSDGSYPEGPYGSEIGATIEDFSFQGYVDPQSNRELESISFSDFYDPDGELGIELLLLNTAAAWCQPCQIEHDDLPGRVDDLEAEGLRVVSLLFQDPEGKPATEQTLRAWTTTFETNFPMALDPAYQMGRYGPAETPPINLVVDPRNMQILAIFVGNQEGPMWAFIESELAENNR